jgi:hypothetical protein
MKKILLIAAIAVIAIVIYSFAVPQNEKKDKPEKGVVIQMNNDLYLKNVADYKDTKEWKFKGDKPVVIDFYADFDDAFAHGLQQTDIQKVMEQNRIELNQQLPNYSQISKIKIHFEEFEKTAKKSIKRFMYQEAKG